MKRLIKAQVYQMCRKKSTAGVYLGILGMLLFELISEMRIFGGKLTADDFFLSFQSVIMSFSFIVAFWYAAEICVGDFSDRTVNYEVMGGYTRKKVYFSRVLLGLASGTLTVVSMWCILVGVAVAYGGWGNQVGLLQMVARWLLMLFPFWRILCEFIFFSFLVKNVYVVMAVGTVIALMSDGLSSMHCFSYALGFTNLYRLSHMLYFGVYTMSDNRSYYLYDATLTTGEVFGTIGASVGFGFLFLLLGYVYFHKDDLR